MDIKREGREKNAKLFINPLTYYELHYKRYYP